ncbi:MAG: helix-turn-helix transcriptional regulator [Sphingobacteriales bacterium]|nr:MAG: helix-turn-helix transcriptional regulator [Sphingobacteriales bacterium]
MKKNKVLVQIGDNIRNVRLKQNLSQEQLSFKAGLDRSYIGSVERGERNIAAVNLVKIAEALNIKPSALLNDVTTNKEK